MFIVLLAGCAAWTIAGNANAQSTLAERGAYLARAGDCVSCHTAMGGTPYAGGDRLDTPFGYLLAPNITPDRATGIGRWSSNEFYRALHNGVNRRGQDMFPAMPYTFVTKVTRADSDAIYACRRSRRSSTIPTSRPSSTTRAPAGATARHPTSRR